VAVRIHTGRTHQIRVHMKAIGHPLLGDSLYGGKGVGAGAPPRVMLHAARLAFRHPVSGEALDLRGEPPRDFQEVEARLADGESR
jgi:23S rRNA pseudouridine1911/1915/1917 synthase